MLNEPLNITEVLAGLRSVYRAGYVRVSITHRADRDVSPNLEVSADEEVDGKVCGLTRMYDLRHLPRHIVDWRHLGRVIGDEFVYAFDSGRRSAYPKSAINCAAGFLPDRSAKE